MTAPDPETPDIKDSLDIDIIVRDARWEGAIEGIADVCRESACAAFHAACAAHLSGPVTAEAALVLADDEFVAALNRQYRDRDGATNVLSFAATDSGDLFDDPGKSVRGDAPVMLGDIIVALETTVREAEDLAISAEHHLRHLVVHGMLHLLGYDHMTDDGAAEMEPLETQILGVMHVADPYGEDFGSLEETRP